MVRKLLFLFLAALLTAQGNAQRNKNKEDVTTIFLKAISGLQYDQVRFRVKGGSTVKIVFANTDEMSHNLVITRPGKREEVVKGALDLGDNAPTLNYIPGSSDVLWYIPVVDPGQTKAITFTAPPKDGIYPYVCTFPGHGFVMFGAMYVSDKDMPPIEEDPNIPPIRRGRTAAGKENEMHNGHSGHPSHPAPPYLYRILMPDAGPAAIAVSLPHELSYCWDAGACRLRYAWQGDFLDPLDYWNKKGEHFAKILGPVFFRDKTQFPLRIDNPGNIPVVDFKGYRLINSYPEFHYSINGIDVFELILPKTDGTGLERTFRIPEASNAIWFVFDQGDGVRYTSSTGKLTKGQLKLSREEARHFTLFMTKGKGATL
jgi:azurin